METRRLHLFVLLADELNFRRAAERASIAQPALTRHVQQLEQALGVALFTRDKRRVELTAAGVQLRDRLRPALRAIDDALAAACSTHGRVVRIGYITPALYGRLPHVIQAFRALEPECRVDLTEMHSPTLMTSLAAGSVDVAFVGRKSVPAGMRFQSISTHPYVVCLHASHALAKEDVVRLAQLDGLTLITPHAREPLHAFFQERLLEAGARVTVQDAMSVDAVLSLVGSGVGFAFVPDIVAGAAHGDVVLRPLAAGLPSLELGAATRRGESSHLVARLISLALATDGATVARARGRGNAALGSVRAARLRPTVRE